MSCVMFASGPCNADGHVVPVNVELGSGKDSGSGNRCASEVFLKWSVFEISDFWKLEAAMPRPFSMPGPDIPPSFRSVSRRSRISSSFCWAASIPN